MFEPSCHQHNCPHVQSEFSRRYPKTDRLLGALAWLTLGLFVIGVMIAFKPLCEPDACQQVIDEMQSFYKAHP